MTFKEFLKRIADKWFCLHDWEYLGKSSVYEKEGDELPIRIKHKYVCKKCGKHKTEKS